MRPNPNIGFRGSNLLPEDAAHVSEGWQVFGVWKFRKCSCVDADRPSVATIFDATRNLHAFAERRQKQRQHLLFEIATKAPIPHRLCYKNVQCPLIRDDVNSALNRSEIFILLAKQYRDMCNCFMRHQDWALLGPYAKLCIITFIRPNDRSKITHMP